MMDTRGRAGRNRVLAGTDMRVVRTGGRYLKGREQRLWVALASVIGLAIGGIVLAARDLAPG